MVDEDAIEIPLGRTYSSSMIMGLMDLDFYVHQKGQLIKRLKHPDFHLDKSRITAIHRKYAEKGKLVRNEMD